jgi:hypothetical protein
MRWLLFVAACSASSPSRPEPDPIKTVAIMEAGVSDASAIDAPTAAESRCLPVVAKECGCVYSCGVGTRDGDIWKVKHAFWGDTELTAKIDKWCAGNACTEAFHADIVCDGICLPKPADSTCHFNDAGACVGKKP